MKYKELLEHMINEGLGTVFHATDVKSANKILADNCFELSPAVGSDAENKISKGKYYFLSTMRSVSSRYLTTDRYKIKSVSKDVYFMLDADKLSHNMKSTPVDYWNMDNFTENEERYLSDKDKICPAEKYIKSIHVLVDDHKVEHYRERKDKTYLTHLVHIKWNGKEKVHYYDNVKDYISRKNSKKLIDILKITEDELDDKLDWSEIRRNKSEDNTKIDYVLQFYSGEKIPTETFKYLQTNLWDGMDSLYARDFLTILSSEIHGGRRSNSKDRGKVKKFIDIMKKYKYKDISKFIKEKFYPDVKKKFKMS